LIGEVKKVETDVDGKVSGPFPRAWIVMDISKPTRRGIMLKKDKTSALSEWFHIQYENMPFFCYSCGLISHFEIAYPTPQPRNAYRKLPYEQKKLCAPDDKKRRPLSFAQVAAEAFGSSSGSGRNRGADPLMQKCQGTGMEPCHS
jgi:hypothetical protein